MPEPELHVRDFTPPMPAVVCESGRHFAHPGDTCEEIDELQAVFRAYLERGLAAAYAQAIAETDAVVDRFLISGEGTAADQVSIVGNGMRGFLPIEPEREPDPAERAFAILEPHLHDVPLYRPRGRILP